MGTTSTTPVKIKAVLFDLDGVLVDAVDLHEKAFIDAVMLCTGNTISHEMHARELNGLPTRVKLEKLGYVDNLCERIYNEKQKTTIDAIRETLEPDIAKRIMLGDLLRNGYRVGCVTNSIRATATLMLTETHLYEKIELLVSNQDVVSTKPHPEGYWKAMSHFGVFPYETLIVEDSDTGYKSALLSGAHTWHVSGPEEVTLMNLIKEIDRCER